MNNKQLCALLFSKMSELLESKNIKAKAYEAMNKETREANGLPIAYRTHLYLDKGLLKIRANKLAATCKVFGLEIEVQKIYFVKELKESA